jgi:hypothetical protein
MMLSRNQESCSQQKKSPSAGCWPAVLIILTSSSSASCAAKATLGFWYNYLNAWELYSGLREVERKSAANFLELKKLE